MPLCAHERRAGHVLTGHRRKEIGYCFLTIRVMLFHLEGIITARPQRRNDRAERVIPVPAVIFRAEPNVRAVKIGALPDRAVIGIAEHAVGTARSAGHGLIWLVAAADFPRKRLACFHFIA